MAPKRTLKRRTNAAQSSAKKAVPKRTLRRPNASQELAQIERLLGEDFESLAQARRALQRETKPVTPPASSRKKFIPKRIKEPAPKQEKKLSKSTPKSTSKQKPITQMSRKEKHLFALKIGKKEYVRRLRKWTSTHEDENPSDNPYYYHRKDE